jgi:hypothetical protein
MVRVICRGGLAWVLAVGTGMAIAQERVVYKCPNNLYTDTITPKEAEAKGCKRLEGSGVTVIQSTAPTTRRPAAAGEGSAARPADTRVESADQKARDADKRRILETELQREEEKLAGLKLTYNNGNPERQGDERNYQKYLDRVNELKASIERSENDVAALKRELSKLTPSPGG